MTTVHAVTIEWQGIGENPHVFVADTMNAALAEAAKVLWDWAAGKGPLSRDALGDPELAVWMQTGEAALRPDMTDPDAVRRWLHGFRDHTTAPWWSSHTTTLIETPVDRLAEDVKVYDHQPRPDDDAEPGDRCRTCGDDITWVGPGSADWLHVDDPDNREHDEKRASGLNAGDVYQEYGDHEWSIVAEVDQHGDTVLLTLSDGTETTLDIDTVVRVVLVPEGATS